MILCAIWYHLYNLNNVKNTHGEVSYMYVSYVKTFHMYVVLDKYKCYGCEAGYYCLGDGSEVNCTTVSKHYFSFGMASSCSKCPEGWVNSLFTSALFEVFQSQYWKLASILCGQLT